MTAANPDEEPRGGAPAAGGRRDLVLGTRLGVLHANLDLVAKVVKAARERGNEVRELQRLHLDLKRSIGSVKVHARSSRDFIDMGSLEEAKQALDSIAKHVEDLEATLRRCQTEIERLAERQSELQPGWDQSIEVGLVRQAEQSRANVENLRRRLDEDDAAADLRLVWGDYAQLLERGEPLFGDYVELLRGLALREVGLDAGICRLADPLLLQRLDRIPGFKWNSLTVPGFRGPASTPSARFVRLGFPEWTIWALPLAAQTFGRIVVSEHPNLRDEVVAPLSAGLDGGAVQHLEQCLSDAIAAWTLGPAYACAAVLMQFDPQPGDAGGRSLDGDRAEMIFQVWERVRTDAGFVNFGAALQRRLRDEWGAAGDQARPAAGGAGDEAAVAADGGRVGRWAEKVHGWLRDNAKDVAYPVEAWESKADDWSRKLLGDSGKIEPRDTDLRDVLNAAWACRVDHPDRVEEIEQAAKDLWVQLRTRVSSLAGGAGQAAQQGIDEHVEQKERRKVAP